MKQSPTFTARIARSVRGSRLFWSLICLSFLVLAVPALSITLVSGGTTQYVIAKQTGCDTTTSQAATDIQTYLRTISGGTVTIPIYSYASLASVPAKAIVIGNLVTSPTLALEQIEMKVSGERLILRGGSSTAHRYAVFGFLEEYLGCRYYAPTVEYIPSISTITVEDTYDVTESPSFEMRYIYQQDATTNGTWCIKNRVNGQISINGTHNMYDAVPPETYFSSHPEYFPLKSGNRTYNTTNQWLCFTNPDLPQIIADYVEYRMSITNSNAIVNIGQGDWSDSCECASCQTAYAADGNAWSGVMLGCLNAAADIVAQTYPTRRMMTFAYMHTEKPPSTTAPRSNLLIRLCHWRRCDLHGLEACNDHTVFKSNLAGWQTKTAPEQLYVWHYTTSFKSQAVPWPNVYSLIPDIQYYWNHDVRGLFYQGVYWGKGCDLSALKQYLMAKAMWNKDVNAETVYNEFLTGYYGDAGDEMAAYIDYLEDRTLAINWHPDGIFTTLDQIKANLLPDAVFEDVDELYDAAEAAASAVGQTLYDRVRYDRFSLLGMHTHNKLQLSRISSPADRLVKLGDNRYYEWKDAFNAVIGDRGCGGEFACDAKARALWKPMQAGDILTVENNKIKLSVCPWLQGAIISLIDKRTGAELLHPARMSDDPTNYPFNGYYSEGISWSGNPYPRYAAETSSVETDGNGNQILTTISEYGIGNWSPSYQSHRLTRVITLPPGDATSFTLSVKVKNIDIVGHGDELLEGRLALNVRNHFTAITATLPDDSTATITTFPTTMDVKQVDYDNGKYGVRLSQIFDQSLPATTFTVSDSPAGMPCTLFTQNDTGTFSVAVDEEKELLKQTWALSEIPVVPVPEDVVWKDFRYTNATYTSGSCIWKNAGLGNGWDADAVSTKMIVGDGYAEFKVNALAKSLVMGLNAVNDDATINEIDYGLETYYSAPNTYCAARVSGTRYAPQVVSSINDIYRVERVGSNIYYKKNGVTFYTKSSASTAPMLVDCSIYTQSTGLTNCRLYGSSYYDSPVVTLTAPVEGAVYAPGSTVTLDADAYTTDGSTISKVEFYRGTTKLGEDTTSPYSYDWANAAAGSYALTAKATTSNSVYMTSTAVNIRVNALPTASVTAPTHNVVYDPAPASITITANAADTDGTISTVEFFENGTYIGEDVSSPYSYDWLAPSVGPHAITVRAIDSDEGETTSASIQVNVEVYPPSVSMTAPTPGYVMMGSNLTVSADAIDTDAGIVKVEFYANGSYIGEDTSSPYSYNWTNVPACIYALTARAYDADGCWTDSSATKATVWNSQDIGTVGLTGSASMSAPTFTVNGAGAGIVGAADAFHYVYTRLSGDCTLIARVVTFNATYAQSRAGVMIRESLDPGSKTAVSAYGKYSNKLVMLWRSSTGGNIQNSTGTTTLSLPYYVKLVRAGTQISAYGSTNGADWTQQGSTVGISMTNPVYVGLAVTSGGTNLLRTATFDSVSIIEPNTPPTVSITSPTEDTVFQTPATIPINADALDSDGTITKVEFYQGATKLGEDSTSPYSFNWTDVPAGTYALTAKAIDDDLAETISTAINVKSNASPTVSITAPTNGAMSLGNSLTVTADASDADGSITRVEFYANDSYLGESTTSPYSFDWTSVPADIYSLTAIAYDDDGAWTESTAVGTTVWASQDIGAVGLTGSASFSSPTFTVNGAGAGIVTATDAFHFVYTRISGDCTIIARVATFNATYAQCRAGVMIRESLAPGSKTMTSLYGKYSNKLVCSRRVTTDANIQNSVGTTTLSLPYYVKLVRSGNNFSAYGSTNAVDWVQQGSTYGITMTNPVYIGLAVTSGGTNQLKTATFDNVSITSP